MKSQYRQYRAVRDPAPRSAVRRRRAAAIAGGVLAALLASIIGLDSVSNGGRLIAAVAAAAKDPASVFDNRSPGARAGGLLQQTKPGHEAPVLSHREGAKPPPMTKEQTAITYAPEEHPEAPPTAVPTTLAVEAPTPTGDFALFSSIDGQPPGGNPGGGGEGGESYFTSPPGGGGGGGGGAITIQTTTPVPEPSVWAMLIVGFFSVGALMRAQRRQFRAQTDLVRVTHS